MKTEKLSINYRNILLAVKEKHDKFINTYASAIEKTLSDFKLIVDVTYARLSFIAKILKDAKIIKEFKEIDVMVDGALFQRSIALLTEYGMVPIYLLNSGRDVFVYEGIAIEHPSNLSLLIWSRNEQTKKYYDVLDDTFDWEKFSIYVTDVIHKSSYKRKEVVENILG